MKTLRSILLLSAIFSFALACFAQAVADAVPAPEADNTATIISVVMALAAGLVAIWQKKQASTARKITESLVLGIEQATQLPQVQAAEKQIKATIRGKAQELGVQPLLHEVVKDLT